MLKPYYYLFYSIYLIFQKWKVKQENLSTMIVLSGLECINLVPLFGVFDLKHNSFFKNNLGFIFIIVYVSFLTINYFLLIHNLKDKKIYEMFANQSNFSKIFGYIVASVYFVGTFVLFILSVELK